MRLNKENFFISFVDESMKNYFFEKPIIYNVELLLFCLPEILSGPWKTIVRKVKTVFKKYPVRRHLHGPFMDLAYHSRDQEVRALAKKKIELGLAIAGEIGAEHIVFHSTFNPLIVDVRYPTVWHRRVVQFWKDLIPVARRNGCIIVIENIFDTHPRFLKNVIKEVNSPYFKACLDVGHAHIFSHIPLEEWIAALKHDLVHIHLHDNHKIFDEHLGLGKGTIDFKRLFTVIDKAKITPSCTLEVKNEREMNASIRYLKKNKLWGR